MDQAGHAPLHVVGHPDRDPAVGVAFKRLDETIEILAGRSRQLTDRLQPVLRPPGPDGNDTRNIRNVAATCPLSSAIDQAVDRLSAVLEGVVDVLDRIEV